MNAETHEPDTTADEAVKQAVLNAALARAVSDGFTDATLAHAGEEALVDPATLARLFPRGVSSLLEEFSAAADREMEQKLAAMNVADMRIRARIAAAVMARLAALRPHKEAARRAAATLSLPPNAGLAMKLLWRTADAMWRAAHDTSTDFNFYTKRAILMGVYSATLVRWFSDDSEDEKVTDEFLGRRIDGVMRFEKFKAEARSALAKFPSLTEILNGGRRRE